MTKYLISVGANIEARSKRERTPFLEAVLMGHDKVMSVLLANGCNIHAKKSDGNGAVAFASQRGHVDICKQLIKLRLDFSEGDNDGYTPLHWASWGGHGKMAEYLISIGADIEAANKWGRTPFLDAIVEGNLGVASLLASKGCNIDAKNYENVGAADMSNLHCRAETKKLLANLRRRRNHSNVRTKSNEEKPMKPEEQTEAVADPKIVTSLQQQIGVLERRLKEERQAATEQKIATEQEKAEILSECETKVARMQISSQHLRERATKAENDLKRLTDLQEESAIQCARLSEQATEAVADLRRLSDLQEETERRCTQLEQEREEACLLAEEAQRNLSKYEEVFKISPDEVNMSDIKLGGGSYGDVRVGHWRGRHVAVKTFFEFLRVENYLARLNQEISICRYVHHPNVVALLGVITQDGIPLSILSELLEGSLSDVIEAADGNLTLKEQVSVASGCSAGISYLHGLDILHGDIRSTNVVVTALMEAKICDLGAARFANFSSLSAGPMSPEYLAPERFGSNHHNTKMADIYSLGVTFIELMTGMQPASTKRMSQAASVRHKSVKTLCLRMVKQVSPDRPSAAACLASLQCIERSDERYGRCPPKRMVKGKMHGEEKVQLVNKTWI
ncbi:serine/threonine-protein kinase TNNI3K-like isoform X2 [Oscarella lobularis]